MVARHHAYREEAATLTDRQTDGRYADRQTDRSITADGIHARRIAADRPTALQIIALPKQALYYVWQAGLGYVYQ